MTISVFLVFILGICIGMLLCIFILMLSKPIQDFEEKIFNNEIGFKFNKNVENDMER